MNTDFKAPRWARIELFGHISYFGRVREIEVFGGRMGSIESLTRDGVADEPVIFGAGALFRVTPMTEEACRRAVLPHSYGPCDTFTPAPVLPERCIDCGYTATEHEEAAARTRLLLAAPETSREGSGRPPETRCQSTHRGAQCELDDDHLTEEHEAFIEGYGTMRWPVKVTGAPAEPIDEGAESSREAMACEPGPDHLRPQ